MKINAFICTLIIAALHLSCLETNTTTFVDPRDQEIYEVVPIGSQKWLGADLKFQTPNSLCYENDDDNCNRYGRLYNFDEANIACPPGWRLPSDEDWKKLETELGMKQPELDSIRIWRGTHEGDLFINTLGVQFSGMGRSNRTFLGKDQIVSYWVAETGPSGTQFALYRMLARNNSKIYSDQIPKKDLCCVRCVKN